MDDDDEDDEGNTSINLNDGTFDADTTKTEDAIKPKEEVTHSEKKIL